MNVRLNIPKIGSLLELLYKECTSEQISDLLRVYQKDNKKVVRISAANKKELLQTNLRRGVAEGAIPLEVVLNFLRECEENGSQHVFYYLPRNKTIRTKLEDHASIRRSLFRKYKTTGDDLPRLYLEPKDYLFSDFHVTEADNPLDLKCVAKFYGIEEYRRRAGKEIHERNRILVPYEIKRERTVLLAVYRGWGLLELRVPRIDKASIISNMHDILWNMITPTINKHEFDLWDLTECRKNLLEAASKYSKTYKLGSTLLMDTAQGSALINPHGEADDLFSEYTRRRAIDAYINHGGPCNNLRVTWLAQKDGEPPTDEVVTLIGAMRKQAPKNEVIVTNKVSGATMDYVAYRLREFQK